MLTLFFRLKQIDKMSWIGFDDITIQNSFIDSSIHIIQWNSLRWIRSQIQQSTERERGKRIFLTCVVRDILWSKKRGRENSRWGDCLKMVADVVRFYKWIFLDFGLQNYSIGNKDILPFFLFYTKERPNLFYSIWPRKENTQCLFTKIM